MRYRIYKLLPYQFYLCELQSYIFNQAFFNFTSSLLGKYFTQSWLSHKGRLSIHGFNFKHYRLECLRFCYSCTKFKLNLNNPAKLMCMYVYRSPWDYNDLCFFPLFTIFTFLTPILFYLILLLSYTTVRLFRHSRSLATPLSTLFAMFATLGTFATRHARNSRVVHTLPRSPLRFLRPPPLNLHPPTSVSVSLHSFVHTQPTQPRSSSFLIHHPSLSPPPPVSSIFLILSPTPVPSSPSSIHLSSTCSHDSTLPAHSAPPSSLRFSIFSFPDFISQSKSCYHPAPYLAPTLAQIHWYLFRYYFSVSPVVFRLPYHVFPVSILPVPVLLLYLFIPFCFFRLLPSFPASLSFLLPLRHLFFSFLHFRQAFPRYCTSPSSFQLLFISPCSPICPYPQFAPFRSLSHDTRSGY